MARTSREVDQIEALVAAHVLHTPFRTPGHGSCCTCQKCGYHHDDCICGCTESPEKAIALLEAFDRFYMGFTGEMFFCTVENGHELGDDWLSVEATEETLGLAICVAVLKANGIYV